METEGGGLGVEGGWIKFKGRSGEWLGSAALRGDGVNQEKRKLTMRVGHEREGKLSMK